MIVAQALSPWRMTKFGHRPPQLRPEELKEIRRRGRGLVACRTEQPRVVDGLVVLPAAVVLLRLAARAPVG